METALSRDVSSTYSLVSCDCRQVNTVVAFSDKSSLNLQLKGIIMVDSQGDRSLKQLIALNPPSESSGESMLTWLSPFSADPRPGNIILLTVKYSSHFK